MSIINIKNLTFCYDGSHDKIFDNISAQLDTQWRLGLVGRNGKGKTTLLKILSNKLEYSGSIDSLQKFEYFPYDIADKSLLLCHILQEIDCNYQEWKIAKEANLLGLEDLDFYKPFDEYSCGEQTKILLATLFSMEHTFLLIDEPTNHLDRQAREVLSKYLSKKSGYIVVSHDKNFLDGCIDHVMCLNKNDIQILACNFSQYLDNKSKQDLSEMQENERLKAEIKRLKEASRRVSEWADKGEAEKFSGSDNKSGLRPDRGFLGAKSAKMNKRASVFKDRMSDSIQEKTTLLKNIDVQDSLSLKPQNFISQNLLTVKNFVAKYGDIKVNKPLEFEVCQGDRLCLLGRNGCGKSSILKAILKQTEYDGELYCSPKLVVDYLPQDTSFLSGSLKEFCQNNNIELSMLFAMLHKLGCEKAVFEKELQDFSQGSKKKVLIAKSLLKQANLYIWDEPLNYLDIIARAQIKNMILSSNASIIFVEHDGDFCDSIATNIIVVEKER